MSFALSAALVATGCGGGASVSDEAIGSAREAIYGGTEDNDANANQAVVSVRIGNGNSFELCSGSLIASNVVLTAHHCVSTVLSTSVACDQNGASLNGNQLGADIDPSTMHVFTGPTPNLEGTPAANGKAVFHPNASAVCNADIALIVLDRSISGVAPLAVRLDAPVTTNDVVRSVGYGENDIDLPVGTRLRKDNVDVLAVGSTISQSQTPLASNEFEVGLSICEGDSGGPAISEATGAVLGVVSRGGACTDGYGHVYESLAGFKSIFDSAFQVAGTSYADEVLPSSPGPDAGAPGNGSSGGDPASPSTGESSLDLRSGAGNCSVGGTGDARFGAWTLGIAAWLLVTRSRRRTYRGRGPLRRR